MSNLMFYELAEDDLANQVQKDFQEAQAIAHQRGVKTKVTLEITIHPEDRDHRGTAYVEYKSAVKAPPRASIKVVTEVSKEGVLVDSGHRQGSLFNQQEGK